MYVRDFDSASSIGASIISLYQYGDSRLGLYRWYTDTPFLQVGYSQAIYANQLQPYLTLNTWHAVRITYDAQQVVSIYIDDVLVGSRAMSTTNRTNDWSVTLGDFDGFIDEVRISDTVRQGEAPLAKAVSLAPNTLALPQNYPNPFNAETQIVYRTGEHGEINLSVHNLTGQTVRTLARGYRPGGEYQSVWDGRDESGRRVASGVYILRLQVGDQALMRRMTLLK